MCTVSTDAPSSGAQFRGDCPAHVEQRLTRDYLVSGEQRVAGSGVSQQLTLTINF
jgi:hypothetical protein